MYRFKKKKSTFHKIMKIISTRFLLLWIFHLWFIMLFDDFEFKLFFLWCILYRKIVFTVHYSWNQIFDELNQSRLLKIYFFFFLLFDSRRMRVHSFSWNLWKQFKAFHHSAWKTRKISRHNIKNCNAREIFHDHAQLCFDKHV